MLQDLVTSNRDELIVRCRTKTRKRFEPREAPADLEDGVPLFLQHLVDTLRIEESDPPPHSAGSPAAEASRSKFRGDAAAHGAELLRHGYSIDQVVHEYGDVCQSVTALAMEKQEPISTREFSTLNRCLDDAIADAVTSYAGGQQATTDEQAQASIAQVSAASRELSRLAAIAIQSFAAIRTGNVGLSGATGTLLSHTLEELRRLGELRSPANPAGG
jgi:hypothetical protein